MKNTFIIGGIVLVLLVGGSWWSKNLQNSDPGVISRDGLHWHPTLEIYVGEKKIDIPENIGIGAVHQPMHTHDDLPVIHLEFTGIVREDDLVLGQFFKNWGKDMRQFGATTRMSVNGVENTEYEQYVMGDEDKIELYYE